MKLYFSHTSPYARKVRLVVEEKGLQGQVVADVVDAFAANPDLWAGNPLGRVPTLLLDDGEALFDSTVICAYLDSLSDSPRLIPENGLSRWRVLRRESMADGLMDAAYNIVMERKRDSAQQSQTWLDHWQTEIVSVMDAMNDTLDELQGSVNLGHLATAAAIGYLDLRLPHYLERGRAGWALGDQMHHWGALLDWYGHFRQQPCMRATEPV